MAQILNSSPSSSQDEVPTLIMDAHVKNVREASEANAADPAKAGLEKSGIAGTEPEDKVKDIVLAGNSNSERHFGAKLKFKPAL